MTTIAGSLALVCPSGLWSWLVCTVHTQSITDLWCSCSYLVKPPSLPLHTKYVHIKSTTVYAPRQNWDYPQPPTRRLVCPLPPVSGGRGTLAGEKVVGRVPIPTRGIHCGTLYMYVLCAPTPLSTSVVHRSGHGQRCHRLVCTPVTQSITDLWCSCSYLVKPISLPLHHCQPVSSIALDMVNAATGPSLF
jgi:hypothetical protein